MTNKNKYNSIYFRSKTKKVFPLLLKIVLLFACVILTNSSCKKFVDVTAPANQIVTQTLFNDATTVNAALAGMYISMYVSSSQTFQVDLSFCPDNSADDLTFYTADLTYDSYKGNTLFADNETSYAIWTNLYKINYQANAIIEGVQKSTANLSEAIQKKAIGEAKFIRAFCHFYLVNLYGNVPLITTTNVIANSKLPRTAKNLVYQQIIADLKDAKTLLVANYSSSSAGDRIRPNKYAAGALLARVYLYTEDWVNAEKEADTVINKTDLYQLLTKPNIGKVFLKNSSEAIWQMNGPLNGSIYNGYTLIEQNYLYTTQATSPRPYMVFTPSLFAAFDKTNDQRFINWVTSITYLGTTYYYPYKYKQKTTNTTTSADYYMFLRLAEQYLIRSEARVRKSPTDFAGAQNDINVIRNRAGLVNTTETTQSGLLLAIEKERRLELFCEYGHRWYDLKRTGRADAVLGTKPGWTSNAALYPIPTTDRLNDPYLTQNPGYGN